MKFLDFFAGIGGFRKGMEAAGHECVGFCEFDKWAVASYTSMHLITEEQRQYLSTLTLKQRQKEILKDEYRNGEWYANDIRRVYAGDIPKADCWCFGFPCQDISVAGKQVGFQGNRSSLFFRVMYLIGQLKEEDKPTYLFIENVKNLLSVNGGWDFARLLIEMEQGGYDAEWQVLNSKDFGVPQNRERCFIIGHLRNRSTAEIFPVERADRENSIQIIGYSAGHNNNPKIALPVLTPDRAEKRQNGRRFKENGDPMFTLTRADIHGVAIEPTGFNCMPDGICRTLKNQYQKNSGANFTCQTDRGATAVAVKFKNITASTIRKVVPRNRVPILRGQSQENNLDICVEVAEATKQGYSKCRVGGGGQCEPVEPG